MSPVEMSSIPCLITATVRFGLGSQVVAGRRDRECALGLLFVDVLFDERMAEQDTLQHRRVLEIGREKGKG
jgi:hypothetical protein